MLFYSPIKPLNFKTFRNNHPLFRLFPIASHCPIATLSQLSWMNFQKKARETMRSRPEDFVEFTRHFFINSHLSRSTSCGSRKHGIRDETTSITIIPFKNVETLKFNLRVMMNVPGETIENDNPIMMQQRNVSHGIQTDKPFDFSTQERYKWDCRNGWAGLLTERWLNRFFRLLCWRFLVSLKGIDDKQSKSRNCWHVMWVRGVWRKWDFRVSIARGKLGD